MAIPSKQRDSIPLNLESAGHEEEEVGVSWWCRVSVVVVPVFVIVLAIILVIIIIS